MAYSIIHDLEQGVAALIDPELGRALGPIATGEKAVEVLEKFAGAHGVDPATIPSSELESRWKAFVSALTSDVGEIEGDAVRAVDLMTKPDTAAPAAPAEAAPVDPTAATEQAPAEPAQIPGQTAIPAEQPPAEAPPAEAGPSGPVTTAEPGYVICPTCDGWREVTEGGVVKTCPTCDGKGEVPAHLDPEAQHPAA